MISFNAFQARASDNIYIYIYILKQIENKINNINNNDNNDNNEN